MFRDPEIMSKVKSVLAKVESIAPGGSVELRIPPYSAIQCVAGLNHRRGTPPNVVEMSAPTLIDLASGKLKWKDGVAEGLIRASGTLSDLRSEEHTSELQSH